MPQPSAGTALLLLIVLLTGCGADLPAGFINETAIHSDAQLMDLWHQAQQNISQGIYLNPIQHLLYGTPQDFLPGDARALNFKPRMISVRAVPDLTSAQLLVYGVDRPQPTGMVVCPQPSDERVATAFSTPSQHRTHVAASWEHKEPDWDTIVVWEFENHILYGLGYDISWR
ncbi:exported hypothetical protein [Candidatus Sulfotelmatobacter sp. SbA7]|nr:exported hypothetical protein [Candidatus Sulfotelmatobacter sp. SbA7]